MKLLQGFVVSLSRFSSYHSSLILWFETLERKTVLLIELRAIGERHFSSILHAWFDTVANFDITSWDFLTRREKVWCSLGDKISCLHLTHLSPRRFVQVNCGLSIVVIPSLYFQDLYFYCLILICYSFMQVELSYQHPSAETSANWSQLPQHCTYLHADSQGWSFLRLLDKGF